MANEAMGQKVIDGGQGAKAPNNDAMAAEKSRETGAAKTPEPPFDGCCNIPKGQKVV